MSVFGFRKKKADTIDFTKFASSQVSQPKSVNATEDTIDLRNVNQASPQTPSASPSPSNMDFLNTMASSNSPTNPSTTTVNSNNIVTQISELAEVRTNMRKITGKVEDSDNDIYRLMQRIELLEKKIERFENRGL